ncbi:MAG: enoyl-CoA hydratase/isomerase family protein [Alphaproteobacteria bacterium]|nr:enoyl-CoA hydratase/isomerase family protein [Alphaproteobacteria bacterium]
MTETIATTRPAPHVALIELANPPSNALNDATRGALLAALEGLDGDLDLRALVLTGAGGIFCAGDDLREVAALNHRMKHRLAEFADLFARIESYRVPVIAAIEGAAMGGGLELALCCDIRLASPDARFAAAGVNVGLMASVHRLPRLIGAARAKAMLLTGRAVDAETALAYGLVTEIHPARTLRQAALDLARHIATRAPLSVEAAKRQIGRAIDIAPAEAQASQDEDLDRLLASADHREAVAAFLAKRQPIFSRS